MTAKTISPEGDNLIEAEHLRISFRVHGVKLVAVALPNSMIAASALAGTQFALLISGTLIVEEIFGWPGLGRLLIGSITQVDFPVVEAAVVVIAAYVYLINALTDVALIFIDPRTRKQ